MYLCLCLSLHRADLSPEISDIKPGVEALSHNGSTGQNGGGLFMHTVQF